MASSIREKQIGKISNYNYVLRLWLYNFIILHIFSIFISYELMKYIYTSQSCLAS